MQKATSEEIQEFLAAETVFHGAAPAAIEAVSRIVRQESVRKGDRLFSEGQTCEALHFVFEGCGLLIKVAPDGRQRVLHRAIPGDMVGAVPFFDGGGYPASFVGESDCVVLSFPRDLLLGSLRKEPTLALSIMGGMVTRLRSMVALVEKMSFEDTERRLWSYLTEVSTGDGGDGFPRTVEALPTREHIASIIGTVREVVSRRLSRLVDSGHVRIEGRRLVLLKPLK